MQRLILTFLLVILLAACSTTTTSPQLPPPTSAPVSVQVGETTLNMQTLPGWYAYVDDERVILTESSDEAHELVVHIWFPQLTLHRDQHVSDVVRQVADTTRGQTQIIASDPVSTAWSDHETTYFWLGDSRSRSLVIVVRLLNEEVVALNISGLRSDQRLPITILTDLFAYFEVGGEYIGSEIFQQLAHWDELPQLGSEAALQPSNEP